MAAESISYGLGLTRLDESFATFGDAPSNRAVGDTLPILNLPVEKWIQLGRPGWVNFTVGAGPLTSFTAGASAQRREGDDRLL